MFWFPLTTVSLLRDIVKRAAAADALEKREALLQPSYKQIALLYADLHEYVAQSYHKSDELTFLPVVLAVWKRRAARSR